MTLPFALPMHLRLALVTFLLSNLVFSVDAIPRNTSGSGIIPRPVSATHLDSLKLTQDKVKDWMETRIAVAKLQNQMKTNAADYDNVVGEFYSKRETLLESRGWSVSEFENTQERIHDAISAMDISDELEESRADHEQEIADIEANEFYSDEQKQQMIEALSEIREQKQKQYIDTTKPDWPAVKPYRSVFQQLMHWIAGNASSPPDI